jgi:hypothetical protein
MRLTPDRPPICDARVRLPLELARTAQVWAKKPAYDPTELQELRCTLEAHAASDHYAHVVEMTTTTGGWTRWPGGGSPRVLLVLSDCPATGPGKDACSEYEGHPGGHTWQVNDPWNPPPGSGDERTEHGAVVRAVPGASLGTTDQQT